MAQGDRQVAQVGHGLVLLLLCSCAFPPEDEEWNEPKVAASETVGWLGNEAVTYGEIARYIRVREPDVFARTLTRYLLERVTMTEAEPLKITVPQALLTRETSRRMAEWERRVRAASKTQTGKEVEPALWLRRVADLSLTDFRARVREGAQVELIQDRLLRYELLTSPRVEVSILVVKGKSAAAGHLKRLRAGADLEALARKHSVHSSAPGGGRIPFPLVAQDINDAAVRDALFLAKPGALLGPFPIRDGEYFQIYRVESRSGPRKATYAQLERDVAKDLEARPVPVGEYERWRRRILLRHGFRAAAAPGEPG